MTPDQQTAILFALELTLTDLARQVRAGTLRPSPDVRSLLCLSLRHAVHTVYVRAGNARRLNPSEREFLRLARLMLAALLPDPPAQPGDDDPPGLSI